MIELEISLFLLSIPVGVKKQGRDKPWEIKFPRRCSSQNPTLLDILPFLKGFCDAYFYVFFSVDQDVSIFQCLFHPQVYYCDIKLKSPRDDGFKIISHLKTSSNINRSRATTTTTKALSSSTPINLSSSNNFFRAPMPFFLLPLKFDLWSELNVAACSS